MGVIALATYLLQQEMLAFTILVLGLIIAGLQLSKIRSHATHLSTRFFNGNKKNSIEVITSVGALLEAQEENQKKVIQAIEKIREGKNEDIAGLQLAGEAGTAVQDLQNKLQAMREEEARQNWMVKGAALMGEIRSNNASITEYAYQIVSALVKYLEANQGAFYLLQTENQPPVLELLATYAYGKRKHSDGQVVVDIGTGLLGQSVLEKDLLFIKEVPGDYVKITSGLGQATPRCITIVPLLSRGQVYGVIEIASFQVFEKYHLDFLRKITEGIASELADIQRQQHTASLLEQSQHQAQELKAQEEELRQNMEEMRATQESMERVKDEMNAQLKVIDKVMAISKSDLKGNITYVNDLFLQNTLYTREEIIGQNHRILKSGRNPDSVFKEMWETITSGKTWTGELINKAKDGTLRYVDTTIAPLMNARGEIIEYLSARFPTDERIKKEAEMRMKEMELQQQLKQVLAERKKNQAILEGCVDGVISFDEQGKIQFFNHAAEEIFGCNRRDVLLKPVAKLLDLYIVEHGTQQDKNLVTAKGNEINIRTEVTAKDKNGNELSLLLTATKVKLEEGILFTLFAQKISVDLF